MTFRYAHSANYSFYHQMSSKLTKHNRIKKIGHQIHRKHYIAPNNLSLDLADWWNRNNHKKDTSSRGVTTFFCQECMCVSELTTAIGLDNGLLPGRHQVSIWTNAGIVNWTPGNWLIILIDILAFSFKRMSFKISSLKWWLFCLSLDVLRFRLRVWWLTQI